MTTHFVRYYDCGKHIESQCRCPASDKFKTVGKTPCPTCAKEAKEP